MNDTIYTLLNDMDHQTEQYESFEAAPFEVKKWKKTVLSKEIRPKRRWMKYTAAAVCAALLLCAAPPVRRTVSASINSLVYSLSELLGIKKDLAPYSTVIGKSITKKGITVTLNDVILDDTTLMVSYTTETKKDLTDPSVNANHLGWAGIYINGMQVSVGASGEVETIDEHHMVSCLEIEIPDIDPTEQMDMEIIFNVNDKNIGPFAFTTSGNELLTKTHTVPIDKSFTLPDGSKLTLTKYTSSDVNQKVYFTLSSDELDYDIILEGKDDLGNDVKFCIRHFGEGEGRMEVSTIDNGYVNEDASSLTLALKAVEMPWETGKMSNDFQVIEEEFTIELN